MSDFDRPADEVETAQARAYAEAVTEAAGKIADESGRTGEQAMIVMLLSEVTALRTIVIRLCARGGS